METTLVLWLCAIALIIIGLVGHVLPVIPGPPLLFFGFLLAAWAENFVHVGMPTLIILGFLALLSYGVDLWAAMFGAKRFGASKLAVVGAVIGVIFGIFLGFPGVLFGPFIGAVVGELLARKGLRDAARAGIGATIGLVLGAALKIALAFTMIGVFIVARYF
jgi:uncharacterized protein